jgi:hypothetical protein
MIAMRKRRATPKQAHHRGSFDRRAKLVRQAAYANPSTVCHRCGFRLHEGPFHRNDRTEKWEAGHLIDGQPDGPLLPEARSCNRRDAARKTNARRRGQRLPPQQLRLYW